MKKIITLLLVLSLVFALAACATETAPATTEKAETETKTEAAEEKAEPAADPIKIKIGTVQQANCPRSDGLEYFAQILNERSEGLIEAQVYTDGVLGNEKEMTEGVKLGTLECMDGGQLDFVPKLAAVTFPFLVTDLNNVSALLNSDAVAALVEEDAAAANLKVIGIYDAGGLRNITNNVKPIHVPADLEGLKIRVPGIPTTQKSMETFGAQIQSIPYGDVYMALKTGVCDGQENPYINIAASKFQEVQKYCTEVNYQFHSAPLYMNLDLFNGLTPELQDLVIECAHEAAEKINEETQANISAAKQEVVDGGCEVYIPTEDEMKLWQEAAQPVYDYYINEEKLITQAEFDAIYAAAQGK